MLVGNRSITIPAAVTLVFQNCRTVRSVRCDYKKEEQYELDYQDFKHLDLDELDFTWRDLAVYVDKKCEPVYRMYW